MTFIRTISFTIASLFFLVAFLPMGAEAATLRISPDTGVYQTGNAFTVQVLINSSGQPINAAEGTIAFNPRELSVVSVSRVNSIFNLWVTEPTFSNVAGTVNFSGGSPAGYTGNGGVVMSITFRPNGSGASRISFTDGSVLANDGRGTNVLTGMQGGTFTIQAPSVAPAEEIIEYVPPANTPEQPIIESETHPDVEGWSRNTTAELRWALPVGITAVRTLLDESPSSVPTRVYETPINSISLSDLPDGESYFHLQFRNADGWGRIAHYRLAVDTEAPQNVTVALAPDNDVAAPQQVLQVSAEDAVSGIVSYRIKIGDAEPSLFESSASGTITLPSLVPGYYPLIVEALDAAGNGSFTTFSFTIESFERPVFTEYPSEINEEVIPVIKGLTRPRATVDIMVRRVGGEPSSTTILADDSGEFVFIPEGTFFTGVYELSAIATDEFGAQSEVSPVIRIAVQQPGYLQLGSVVVDALSVFVPLIALLALTTLMFWYFILVARRFRRRVSVESKEALDILHREFATLQTELRAQESSLKESRKTNTLTKAEATMIETIDRALQLSQQKVEKEITDVTKLTKKS